MKAYFDSVQVKNVNGLLLPAAGASVRVVGHVSQTNSTIYSDDGITITSNPLTADGLGRFSFFIADGRYDIIISGTGFTTYTLANVEIADVTEVSLANDATWNVGNVNFTGTITGLPTTGTAANLTGPGVISGTFSGAPTMTGAWTFSNASSTFAGTAAGLTGPGAISGTFSGSPTFSGNPTFSGTPIFSGGATHSGAETFTGQILGKDLEAIKFVDSANSQAWAGADVGAWLNAAYAALPSTGGTIYLANLGTSCMNFSTPIVFATAGKYLILNGLQPGTSNNANPGGACLNYTPTTATDAITADWTPLAGGGIKSGSGINYITLINNSCATIGGCGSSANGIRISKTNGGVENGLFNGLTVQGFGIGIFDNNAATVSYGMTFNNLSTVYNTTGCNFIGYESLHLVGFYAQSNATGFSMASGEVTFYGGGIESNTVNNFIYTGSVGLARANFYGVHFENLGNLTQHYISGPINLTISGGTMLDDFTAGPLGDWMISVGGNHIRIDGLIVSSTRTAGITSILNVPGPGATRGVVNFMVNSPLVFTNRVNGGNAKAISDFSTQPNTANPYSWNVEGPLAIGGTTGLLNTPVTITAPATGGSAFTNTLQGANDTFVYRGTTDTFTGVKSFAAGTIVPSAANTTDLGSTALPFLNLWLGTAATNNFKFQPAATAAARVISMPDPLGAVNLPYVIANGTSTLTSNAALAAVTSQAAITTAATNTLTTDSIEWAFATAPTAGDNLCHVLAYVTAGNVNFVRTNPTAAAQNVSALVVNWRVIR